MGDSDHVIGVVRYMLSLVISLWMQTLRPYMCAIFFFVNYMAFFCRIRETFSPNRQTRRNIAG